MELLLLLRAPHGSLTCRNVALINYGNYFSLWPAALVSARDIQKFYQEFRKLYRGFPALWKVNRNDYKDKRLKGDCYGKLIKKLGNRPQCDPDHGHQEGFHSYYWRELKKIISEKSGEGIDDICRPSLSYIL